MPANGSFALVAALLGLHRRPHRLDLVGRLGHDVAENVAVATDQLVVDAAGDVGQREVARLLGDRGVQHDLEQHVAEFAFDRVDVTARDRFDRFVGLFEHEARERLDGSARRPTGTARAAGARVRRTPPTRARRGRRVTGSTPRSGGLATTRSRSSHGTVVTDSSGRPEALQHDHVGPVVERELDLRQHVCALSHWPTSSGPRSPAASAAKRCPSTRRTPAANGSTPRRVPHQVEKRQRRMHDEFDVVDAPAAARPCARRSAASPERRRAPRPSRATSTTRSTIAAYTSSMASADSYRSSQVDDAGGQRVERGVTRRADEHVSYADGRDGVEQPGRQQRRVGGPEAPDVDARHRNYPVDVGGGGGRVRRLRRHDLRRLAALVVRAVARVHLDLGLGRRLAQEVVERALLAVGDRLLHLVLDFARTAWRRVAAVDADDVVAELRLDRARRSRRSSACAPRP